MPQFFPDRAQLQAYLSGAPATVRQWAVTNGVWWFTSVVGHVAVLSIVLLALGKIASPPVEGEAPSFESGLDTELRVPQIDRFEVGDTPLEPSELNTETLSLVDAPQIESDTSATDAADAVASGGGSASAPSGGIGGLDQFAVKALGPGPLVKGSGMAASGSGKGKGSGGGGTGFGARGDKDSRRAMVGGYGGTKASERAVAAALNWLARHQMPDGNWSINGFSGACKDKPCDGPGSVNSDVAATAMALLPFLAAGQTHQSPGPYKDTIGAGLSWLISKEKGNGDLRGGADMYTHGLAAITLCEAYGLSRDPRVRVAAQQAIRFVEASQFPRSGGWHYKAHPDPEEPPPFGDTSVVGWQVMALKSAQMAGLEVSDETMSGAQKWLKSVASGTAKGLFAYQPAGPPTPSLTSVGLLCTQYMGAKREDPAIQEGMAYLMRSLPNPAQRNAYYWYYGTQVLHNLPGPEWDLWNRQMRRVLIESQVKDGCAAGSWDPLKPTADAWQTPGGRLMVTSLCCLTLEVYYRYLPLYKLDAQEKSDIDTTQTNSPDSTPLSSR